MQVTLTKDFVGSEEWQKLRKEAQARQESDMGLRDEGIWASRIMERVRRALCTEGVASVTLTDEEATKMGLLMNMRY